MTVNTASAGSRLVNLADDMAAYDALPEPVRRAMREANITVACADLLTLHRDYGFSAHDMVSLIGREELDELVEFNAAHRRRHGYPLPHVAAGITILRPAYLPPDLLRQAYQEQAAATGNPTLAWRAKALAAEQGTSKATEGEPDSASRTPPQESRGMPDSPDSARTFAAHFRRPE